MTSGLLVVDEEGRVRTLNPAALKMLGMPAAQWTALFARCWLAPRRWPASSTNAFDLARRSCAAQFRCRALDAPRISASAVSPIRVRSATCGARTRMRPVRPTSDRQVHGAGGAAAAEGQPSRGRRRVGRRGFAHEASRNGLATIHGIREAARHLAAAAGGVARWTSRASAPRRTRWGRSLTNFWNFALRRRSWSWRRCRSLRAICGAGGG